jgi:hypothetical protein
MAHNVRSKSIVFWVLRCPSAVALINTRACSCKLCMSMENEVAVDCLGISSQLIHLSWRVVMTIKLKASCVCNTVFLVIKSLNRVLSLSCFELCFCEKLMCRVFNRSENFGSSIGNWNSVFLFNHGISVRFEEVLELNWTILGMVSKFSSCHFVAY